MSKTLPAKALIPLLLLTAIATLSACAPRPQDHHDTVSVQGKGTVKARPDTFILVATASQRGDDVPAMKKAVDSQVGKLLDLADKLDIDNKQVNASDLNIAPQWQYQPERKLLGYQVSRDVTFRVKGMDRYARLTDAVTRAGITDLHPGGSEISNADQLADEALKKAVEDARDKARILAKAADRKLGKAEVIDSQGNSTPGPVPLRMAMAKQADNGSYQAGEQDVTATVRITFGLR